MCVITNVHANAWGQEEAPLYGNKAVIHTVVASVPVLYQQKPTRVADETVGEYSYTVDEWISYPPDTQMSNEYSSRLTSGRTVGVHTTDIQYGKKNPILEKREMCVCVCESFKVLASVLDWDLCE